MPAVTAAARFTYPGVTVDSSHSRDLDDAIWVDRNRDGWQVTVSIADVSGSVPIGSPDDALAYDTAFSRYAATRTTRPMLPVSLSEDRLTLLPGRAREVMGVTVLVSGDLSVSDVQIAFGELSHRGRLNHEQASSLIDAGDPELHPMMARAWELASNLLNHRRTGGALAFFSSASGLVTNEEGGLVELGVFGPVSRAYIIVQELMILANRCVAEHFARRGICLLYRNHRANPLADRHALREDIEVSAEATDAAANAARARLGMLLGRATLGTTVTGHFGLNIPVYAWFTSPIRRYADLVNQRIIKATLLGKTPPYDPTALDQIAIHLNETTRLEAERRSASFKETSERRAHRAAERSNFSTMGEAAFQAVVKAVFVAGDGCAIVPEPLAQEVLSRLSAGRLPDKSAARVLLCSHATTVALKTGLLRGMEDRTAMAMSIVNYMTQAHALTPPDWEETASGSDHAPNFCCCARAALDGRDYAGATVSASRRMEGRQRAALALLAEISEASWKPPATWLPNDPGSRTPSSTPTADDNAKGKLQELCQKRSWSLPVYTVTQSGPSHAPSFQATAQVRTPKGAILRSAETTGTTRKVAEHCAAADLLGRASKT